MGWVTQLFSISFHVDPVSITLCLKLPTVAAVRGRPSLLLSPLDCLEWPVTAAPLCLWLQYSLTPFPLDDSTSPWLPFWTSCHGCAARISLVVKKSHAVHSDTLSPKAAASVRHDGVSSVRSRSADAGKTIVVLFVVVCPLPPRLHTAYFLPLWHSAFWGLVHTSVAFKRASNISVFTCVLIIQLQPG